MASQLSPPSSQKAGDRPISFLLDNQASGAPQAFVDLVIRPEDLTFTESSRASVQQTLGGAFVDNFGPNLVPPITISGHTGWRRTLTDDDDGLARFTRLKTSVFDEWHKQRKDNLAAGLDPNAVRLIFSDALDDLSVVVMPMTFVLRRNRARPLLAQYQISLVVLDTALQNAPYPAQFGFNGPTGGGLLGAVSGLSGGILQSAGLASITSSIGQITSMAGNLTGMIQSNLLAPVQGFMQQTSQLYSSVVGAVQSVSGIAGSLIAVANTTAQAGANIFQSLATVANIPQIAKSALMSVASAYTNIGCVLTNALQSPLQYQDFSSLYGSSNCSSTAGGRPPSVFAGTNPFESIAPTLPSLPVSLTQEAQGALQSFASADSVLAPLSNSAIGTGLAAVTGGFSVSSVLGAFS